MGRGREWGRERTWYIWMPFNLKIVNTLFSKVIVQTEDIIRCRIQQRNIITVVEKLQLCLPGESNDVPYVWCGKIVIQWYCIVIFPVGITDYCDCSLASPLVAFHACSFFEFPWVLQNKCFHFTCFLNIFAFPLCLAGIWVTSPPSPHLHACLFSLWRVSLAMFFWALSNLPIFFFNL